MVPGPCVTIGHQLNQFKRLYSLRSPSIFPFSHIVAHSSFKVHSKQREAISQIDAARSEWNALRREVLILCPSVTARKQKSFFWLCRYFEREIGATRTNLSTGERTNDGTLTLREGRTPVYGQPGSKQSRCGVVQWQE